ncbi:MAG: energy transducer TonB [Deltaproteobacteria bacterium]|nr:energy transducer TonB [Deltaproteobacteria bacterium]
MLFKKRFFFISILLHGTVLLLLFSWEVPLAKRVFPKSILQVSLVETIEKKPKIKKAASLNLPKREDLPKTKEVEIAVTTPAVKKEGMEESKEEKREIEQEKKEEQKQQREPEKAEPAPAELREEKPGEKEKLPPEPLQAQIKIRESREKTDSDHPGGDPQASGPSGPVFQDLGPRQTQPAHQAILKRPQSLGGRGSETSALSSEGIGNSAERMDSSPIFLASAGLGKGGKEIPGGGGSRGSGPAKEDEAPLRLTKIPSSSQEIDPILLEIIRKIESAKRYPKIARKMGIEGTAVVRFKLQPKGQIETVEIVESSGSEILDKASIETVRDAAPFPYKEGWLKVGIVFKIL